MPRQLSRRMIGYLKRNLDKPGFKDHPMRAELHQRRKDMGLSAEQIAQRIGISVQHWRKWEYLHKYRTFADNEPDCPLYLHLAVKALEEIIYNGGK